jgi:hypothetical protein
MNNPDKPPAANERREMYGEIASLLAGLAKALAIKDSEAAAGVETGAITLAVSQDANGNRFVAATFEGKTARLYPGAIKHDPAPDA